MSNRQTVSCSIISLLLVLYETRYTINIIIYFITDLAYGPIHCKIYIACFTLYFYQRIIINNLFYQIEYLHIFYIQSDMTFRI